MKDGGVVPPVLPAIAAELQNTSTSQAHAYLVGARRDGTYNSKHNTLRIAQREVAWLRILQILFHKLGSRSWIYREGERHVWVVETTCRLQQPDLFSTRDAVASFIRGYFDAEGGVPRNQQDRFYIQFVQKDLTDLCLVRSYLGGLGVSCGKVHNPSKRVDPDYWRFYVSTESHRQFAETIGSWHPRKRSILDLRFG